MVTSPQSARPGDDSWRGKTVVIIGAGQAGASAALRLRRQGFDGEIILVGEEPSAPYQRPPLSKKYLTGEIGETQLLLKSESVFGEQSIQLLTGCRVTGIDRAARLVYLSGGRAPLKYWRLVFATGGKARPLPESVAESFDNVMTFRSLEDARKIRASLQPGMHMLVIGGGYIGLETAATGRKLGVDVTLVESADRILRRVSCEATADYFRDLHLRNGVRILEGAALRGIEGEGRQARLARLDDGSEIVFDLAVVGIGLMPDTELAEAAGIDCASGIVVDGYERTSDPFIFAAGDCAVFDYRGAPTRLESVQNAIEQAEHLADSLLDMAPSPYSPHPWFWSDQYDVKLQIAGFNRGYSQVVQVPGARAGSVSNWYLRGGRMIAVDAINDPRAFMQAKRWLGNGEDVREEQIIGIAGAAAV